MKRYFPILLIWILAAFTPAAADYNQGIEAIKRGDFKTAHKELLPLAEKGNSVSQYLVGVLYQNGHGVPQDYKAAAKWYRKAAEQGHSTAQNELGTLYANGWGVPRNFSEAFKWVKKAADQGYVLAQFNLGFMYEKGRGVQKNYTASVKWYRRAAEQGNSVAQYQLGLAYANGQGISKSYSKAAKWFRKSAEQGYARAQYNIGYFHVKGMGVPKNLKEAAKWIRKSAEQGIPVAQLDIGLMYAQGQGVKKDYVKSYMWLKLADKQGVKNAKRNLKILSKRMTSAQVAKAKRLAGKWKPSKPVVQAAKPKTTKPKPKSEPPKIAKAKQPPVRKEATKPVKQEKVKPKPSAPKKPVKQAKVKPKPSASKKPVKKVKAKPKPTSPKKPVKLAKVKPKPSVPKEPVKKAEPAPSAAPPTSEQFFAEEKPSKKPAAVLPAPWEESPAGEPGKQQKPAPSQAPTPSTSEQFFAEEKPSKKPAVALQAPWETATTESPAKVPGETPAEEPMEEVDEGEKWAGKVNLAVGVRDYPVGSVIPVTFQADSIPPCLRLAVYGVNEAVSKGSWSDIYVNNRARGQVELPVPAVPGDYEVRAYPGKLTRGTPSGKSGAFRVVFKKIAEAKGAPMEPVATEWGLRSPPETPKEPPLTTTVLPDGRAKGITRAIADFNREWLNASPQEPLRSLQLEIKEPPVSFNLGMAYSGEDRQSPLNVELSLKLKAKKVKQIIKGSPITLGEYRDLGKGMFLYRLNYPGLASQKTAPVLARLLAESQDLGHPATRGPKKKKPVQEKKEKKEKEDKPKSIPLWETDKWNEWWPMPLKRARLPKETRQFYVNLRPFEGESPLRLSHSLLLRFDWSQDRGLDFNWSQAHRLSSFFGSVSDRPVGIKPGQEFKRILPTLNGKSQTPEARPKVDKSTGKEVCVESDGISYYWFQTRVDHHVKVKTDGNRFQATWELYGQQVKKVVDQKRKKQDEALFGVASQTEEDKREEKERIRARKEAARKKREEMEKKKAAELEKYYRVRESKTGRKIDRKMSTVIEEERDPFAEWQDEPEERKPEKIEKEEEPGLGGRRLYHRWTINGVFDPETLTFSGIWLDEELTRIDNPIFKKEKFRQKAIEYIGGPVKKEPIVIVNVESPEGLVRSGEVMEIKVKIASTEDPKNNDAEVRPFDLFLHDIEAVADASETVSGTLNPGARLETDLKVFPPRMNGQWAVRVVLKSGDVETKKDLVLYVGTFPVRIVNAKTFRTRVGPGSAPGMVVALKNIQPASRAEDPRARGVGSWGVYDYYAGAYPVLQNFDLGPGQSLVETPHIPSPEVEGGLKNWKLAVILLNEKGEIVKQDMLPPIEVDGPPEKGAGPGGEFTSEEIEAVRFDHFILDGYNREVQLSNLELKRITGKMNRLYASIQRNQKSENTEGARENRRELEKLTKLKQLVLKDKGKLLNKKLKYFKGRLKELPQGSPRAEALKAKMNAVISGTKLSLLENMGARGDVKKLRDIAHAHAEGDKHLAAEALKQMAGAYYQKGKRTLAHASFRKAGTLRSDDPDTMEFQRRLEAESLQAVSNKIDTEIESLKGTLRSELGSHGEAGMWGYAYDTLSLGGGTLADSLRSKLTGEQSAVENVQEIVSAAENEGRAQQVGLKFMGKMVESGLNIERISKLKVTHLFATRALASNGWSSPKEGIAGIDKELNAPGLTEAKKKKLERMRVHLKKISGDTTFKDIFPGLKKMMDGGGAIPDRSLVSAYVSVRAALNNPDVKKIAEGSKLQLAVDHPDAGLDSYLGVETLRLSGKDEAKKFILDMPNMMMVLTMAPSAQVLKGGPTVAESLVGALGSISPAALDAVKITANMRSKMPITAQLALDTAVSIAAEQGATYATGDPKFGFMVGGFVDGMTNVFDAEGVARKMVSKGVSPSAVSNVSRGMKQNLEAFAAPAFSLGATFRQLDTKMVKGFANSILDTLRTKVKGMKNALKGKMTASLRNFRKTQTGMIEKLIKQLEIGNFAGARKTLRNVQLWEEGMNEMVVVLRKKRDQLKRAVFHMDANLPPSAKKVRLENDFIKITGSKKLPNPEVKLSVRARIELLKDPVKVRKMIREGVLSPVHEEQLAKMAASRLKTARNEALEDLAKYRGGRYARLFDHFRDTGSWWNKPKNFRDIDFTPKLVHKPDETLLRSLYKDVKKLKKMSYEDLLDYYRKDNDLKREVMLLFEEKLGEKLAKAHKRGGSPRDILKEYDVVVNEIPGSDVLGKRQMSKEEYRLAAGFARTEASVDKNVTRVIFGKDGKPKLKTGFTVDGVRLPGDVPTKFEPKHSYAKVYDEWMMFNDHFSGKKSNWDNLAGVYKYSGRVNSELSLLARAPDALLGQHAASVKKGYQQVQETFANLLTEGKTIKELAKTEGYSTAMEKALSGRLDKFRAMFPDQPQEAIKKMAAAEYLKETRSYLREMADITKQIDGARPMMQAGDPVGAKFHEYVSQNSRQKMSLPWPP